MEITKTIDDTRQQITNLRSGGKKIALVPTMGALHKGHITLIQLAKQHADHVVVSIFVNPEQFAPNEDYNTYPRELEEDLEKCRREGVSLVFAPAREAVYDDEKFLSIKVSSLNGHMCGGSRPGFFEGVLLIVNKLFNIIQPDLAVFGQKDIQQFQIIRAMVQEFNHSIELMLAPIERANDGLALSSRNAYLKSDERVIAPGLYRALTYVEKQINDGVHTPKLMLEHQKSELEAKGFRIDYLNVFSRKTLQPVTVLKENTQYIIAGAVWLGNTRLIDNILIDL